MKICRDCVHYVQFEMQHNWSTYWDCRCRLRGRLVDPSKPCVEPWHEEGRGCDMLGLPLDPRHPWNLELGNRQRPVPKDWPMSLWRHDYCPEGGG